MSHSKYSILIVENDCHVSRVVHSHLEKAFPNVRVEIAGSSGRAKQICEKFPPSFIIWDGAAGANGQKDEYVHCIPDALWSRVIPISNDNSLVEIAKGKGAHAPIPKADQGVNSWSEKVVEYLRPLMPHSKKH